MVRWQLAVLTFIAGAALGILGTALYQGPNRFAPAPGHPGFMLDTKTGRACWAGQADANPSRPKLPNCLALTNN